MHKTPIILPISGTTVNWQEYVTRTKDLCGRSPTRSLDAAGVPVGDVFSFLASLAEFQHKGTNPFDGVRQANRLLRAVSVAFLCDTLPSVRQMLREETDLFIITPEDRTSVFILSGNLYDIRDAIIECSNERKDFDLRFFMNALCLVLGKLGLNEIFKANRRQTNTDGTFSLV